MDLKKNVQVSLLDRLVDLDPEAGHESVQFRLADFNHIQTLVKRDLENLLNTRCGLAEKSKTYPETFRSVLYYGLRDYSADTPGSIGVRDKMIKDVERAIQRFEPRIKNVKVRLDIDDDTQRSLSFQISGLLVVDPIREPVTFDSYYDPIKKGYVISG